MNTQNGEEEFVWLYDLLIYVMGEPSETNGTNGLCVYLRNLPSISWPTCDKPHSHISHLTTHRTSTHLILRDSWKRTQNN